ncbi:SubName: Full=Uncharacterized protein {ECO:0000313/EMBL:CCA70707.1} [Serendipita indica DSM 11827]|uniref:NADAR domain-containing protein n=1 Tax=Serendipita indica (strain DSM 11827) TaxID=1109443 RepID=G4THB4_SERID|nr:SubName: Full=Uncharacterized protein {ECO:0000313/EMBL:CCA70707.1} [Serendipita indica DSM 11827]CCA70707.1 hypothetical protein PIIN_04641 [Serendipita indica DSM 11827]
MTTPLPGPNAKIFFSTRHEAHSAFTNVSNHPINYQGRLYDTAEHLYHAFKFIGREPVIAELVRKSTDPQRSARDNDDKKRPDWANVHLFMMEQVLTLKFHQYPGLKNNLLATGDAQLIQLGSDQYWSQQEDGSGDNQFGHTLMRVRSTLRR